MRVRQTNVFFKLGLMMLSKNWEFLTCDILAYYFPGRLDLDVTFCFQQKIIFSINLYSAGRSRSRYVCHALQLENRIYSNNIQINEEIKLD